MWAGASPFHTGGCATIAALLPSCVSRSPGGCSEPTAGRTEWLLPSKSFLVSQTSGAACIPTGSCTILRERERREGRGGKGQREEESERRNTARTSNKNQHSAAQLQQLSPQKGRTSMTKLVFSKCSPAWAPPALQLLFPSLSQQITCRCTSHLPGLQPPLSEVGGEREGK